MTGLLVSVRSAAEATAAVDGGASVIDIKEPDRGPLGRASAEVWRAVLEAVPDPIPVSVALGELRDWEGLEIPRGIAYRKLGLAASGPDWRPRWLEAIRDGGATVNPAGAASRPPTPALPHGGGREAVDGGSIAAHRSPSGSLPPRGGGLGWGGHRVAATGNSERPRAGAPRWVAVAYADWRAARSPEPEAVLDQALETPECAGVLVDTWDKTKPSPLEASDRWAGWIDRARRSGRFVALAGGLDRAAILRLAPLRPDLFAVRGAACGGSDRRGRIDPERVADLVRAVKAGVS